MFLPYGHVRNSRECKLSAACNCSALWIARSQFRDVIKWMLVSYVKEREAQRPLTPQEEITFATRLSQQHIGPMSNCQGKINLVASVEGR